MCIKSYVVVVYLLGKKVFPHYFFVTRAGVKKPTSGNYVDHRKPQIETIGSIVMKNDEEGAWEKEKER